MAKKQAEPESKFAPGQLVRFTDEGLARYRGDARDEMIFERSARLDDITPVNPPLTAQEAASRFALVRYSDGSEAVYEEAYLEAV